MQSTNDDTLGVLGFTFADSVMTLHYIQISISYVIYLSSISYAPGVIH